MKKAHRKTLADFIEQRLDMLTDHLLSHPDNFGQEALRPLINSWLVNQAAHHGGKSYRAGEWTSRVADHFQDAGGGFEEAHRIFRLCRNALIAYCLTKVKDMAEGDIYSLIMEGADIHDAHLIEFQTQRMREQEAAERRRCGMIAEAVNYPLALLNGQGFIETANRPFARCLAVTPESLMGRDMLALCNTATANKLRSSLRHKSAGKKVNEFPGALYDGKGKIEARFYVHQLFDASGIRTGAVLCLDAGDGDAHVSNDSIHDVEAGLLAAIPFPLQVFNEDGVITFSSKAVKTFLPGEYAYEEPLCCYLYRQHKQPRPCPCRQVFKTGQFHMEEYCHSANGDTRWHLLLISPAPQGPDQTSQIICCAYDLTRRKQIQKQLETEVIVQQRSSLMAQIAVTVAHQLRNPLSVVLGFAEMMAKGLPPEQTTEAVSRILRNALRCKDIVENLLHFGKGMPLERRVLDFATLVRESVRPMLTPAQNRIIEWRLTSDAVPIECVPEQLAQVTLSLLDNALRAAESRVVCMLETKGDVARFRVMDDGPGIPGDLRERVFEPFFTTRRDSGAVGLGLSLARAVAHDYGGSLTLSPPRSSDPGGACLMLQLALLKTGAESADDIREEQATPSEAPQARRVLVVDDEADLLDLLKTALYMRGYLVDAVSSGADALERLQANAYDIAVIDFQLTGAMSGTDVYEHIKARSPKLCDHVLFITADTMNYKTRLLLENTGRPVLEKPFLIADFVAELQKIT